MHEMRSGNERPPTAVRGRSHRAVAFHSLYHLETLVPHGSMCTGTKGTLHLCVLPVVACCCSCHATAKVLKVCRMRRAWFLTQFLNMYPLHGSIAKILPRILSQWWTVRCVHGALNSALNSIAAVKVV
jgi:hypothetical protein